MTTKDDRGLRVLVVGDADDNDQGFVGERLVQHGATIEPLDRDRLPDYASVGDQPDLILLLGSARSGASPEQAGVVEREAAFVLDAIDAGVPVLGICYGSQLLAHALGGAIKTSPQPEIGIDSVPTNDPVLCPPGPWVLMHSDAFDPPPGAHVFGSTAGGCVGFSDDGHGARVLAWQYHPEVRPDHLAWWLERLVDWVTEHGGDPETIQAQGYALADDLRERAYALTDAALEWLFARIDTRAAS